MIPRLNNIVLLSSLIIIFSAKFSFSQEKPDLLRYLPPQIGIDGKSIYDGLIIDSLIAKNYNINYRFEYPCRLKEFCYVRPYETTCDEVFYHDDKIVKIKDRNWEVNFGYDWKDRLVSVTTGGGSRKVTYDALDRMTYISNYTNFSGHTGSGSNFHSKSFEYNSEGKISVFNEVYRKKENVSNDFEYNEKIEYFYNGDLLFREVSERIEIRQGFYEDLIDTIYRVNDFFYEDDKLVLQIVSDEQGPKTFFEYMISDSLEETVRFGIVNGVKKKNNKRTKRFNDGLLIEDIYYNYQDSIYKESWRYVYEYDSLDRISKQEFYKESKVNNVEKFLYNSDGDLLKHDEIKYKNGIEESRYLTLY